MDFGNHTIQHTIIIKKKFKIIGWYKFVFLEKSQILMNTYNGNF